MLSILFLLFCNVFLNQAAILQCDFETVCNDFLTDRNWGLTDGKHPRPIDHDHTLNTSSGHYCFYNPPNNSRLQLAEIQTNGWLEPSPDRAVCFRMWYYTPRLNLPFNIQLVQGDDELLTRIVASIPGKDPEINDWTLVNVTLPNEKVKLFIRLNDSIGSLAFDDISVDYCDEPPPMPTKILFTCDFESSCSDDFVSLPYYPYQWAVLKASDAVNVEHEAPSVDYTFGNQSGHYALLLNSGIIGKSNVGYFHLQKDFQITSAESYCLNFQYYSPEPFFANNLIVYSWTSDQFQTVQILWPTRSNTQYVYTSNQWTWGIINLPIGNYSLLFRVDSTNISPHTLALDNIDIISCDYPSWELSPYNSFLSFSCDFDNLTMCDMINGDDRSMPTFNFTVLTGDTIPNRELGPTRDHTSNSSTGGFIYWNQELPFTTTDFGTVHISKGIQQNNGMCVKFAYYVKSLAINKNATTIMVSAGGCYGGSLWRQSLDDSRGWQTVVVPVLNFACAETFSFSVNQDQPIAVSVAYDDIEIDQCKFLSPTSTTTSTSTTTASSTTTSTVSTTSSTISIVSTTLTTTPVITKTSSASSTTTVVISTTPNNAHRLSFLSRYNLIIICFLFPMIRKFVFVI